MLKLDDRYLKLEWRPPKEYPLYWGLPYLISYLAEQELKAVSLCVFFGDYFTVVFPRGFSCGEDASLTGTFPEMKKKKEI